MQIGEVLNGVFDDELGWRPASGGIKPVHLANGLMRAVTGSWYDLEPLLHVMVARKYGAAIPDRTLERLLTRDWGGALAAFRGDDREFERMRRYLRGILNADGAVFPSADHSSVSLTCGLMASRDSSDRGLGEFAFELLGGADVEMVKLLAARADVARPTDPLTIAAWPLLGGPARPSTRSGRSTHALKQRHCKAVLAEFAKAVECLASHEEEQGNRLRTLQRAVHFSLVATHAHAQAISSPGGLDDRAPALLVTDVAKGTQLAVASERSVRLIHERLASWLAEKLAQRIEAKKALNEGDEPLVLGSLNGHEVRRLLKAIGSAGKVSAAPDEELLAERMSAFNQARRLYGKDVARCIATTLVECYLREYESGGPRQALTRMGARAGLLYPHAQGRSAQKRFQPSTAILDMLVRACVSATETVPLHDFLERLWRRFGMIVGDRKDSAWNDGEVLHRNGVSVDPAALVENTEAFVSQLVTMGLARRYPDNVTFVGAANVH